MRTRDVTIPLGLWICAAICAHFFLGTGGLVVAKVHDDRSELWKLAREASSLAQQGEQTFEVSLNEPSDEPAAPPPAIKPPAPPPPPPAATAKVEPPKPERQKPKEEKKLIVLEKKKEEEKKPLARLEPLKERRIAVVQAAKPNQEDNPTAKFIAERANHVQEETQARLTSHDRNDEVPSPGATHASADRNPGDSEKDRTAEADAHKGEKNRAPGERGTDFDVQHEPRLPKPEPAAATASQSPPATRTTNETNASSQQAAASERPQPAPGGATPASPEVETAPGGAWTFNPARQGGAPSATTPAPTAGEPTKLPGGRLWSMPGLGQSSTPGGINTNLNQTQIAFIVGADNLRKLREADGERRKSQHRGSWTASNFDRWRSAIENYVASVKVGNQTALNTAGSPFATYLNGMHNRIHPIFAESFLESLDALPADHPLNDQHLVTVLEIILTKDGHLKRMGVVRTSGITAFDVAALDAVDRAQPFGPAPGAIVSADGNVYLHWEFHRDEGLACSTMGASPYILNSAPPAGNEGVPQLPAAPPPGPSLERTVPGATSNDAREGMIPRRPGPIHRG